MQNNNLLIISGGNDYRYDAHLNHKNWAEYHKIAYKFYLNNNLSNPYFTKCYAILDAFKQGYENVLWVDDDVFFINLNWNAEKIFLEHEEDIIVTQGRTNKKSGITLFNNGIMFIRNSDVSLDIFNSVPKISWNEMQKNWSIDWGPLEGNDQPRMIYLTQTKYKKNIKIIPYPGFNAHEITFKQKRHFLQTNPPFVHITGKNKEGKIKRFQEVTGISLP